MAAFESVETPTAAVSQVNLSPEPPVKRNRIKEFYFGIPGILTGAILGVALGALLHSTSPSKEVVSWIGVPGSLFIRAVKCLVTPLVFCSLLVGMADMLAVGKASRIGWRTTLLYLATTMIGAVEGLLWVLIFRSSFGNKSKSIEVKLTEFAFACEEPGHFLTHVGANVSCVYDETYNKTSKFSPSSVFVANDIHDSFAKRNTEFTRRTLSQAFQGQLDAIVPSNITQAFADATLLSIIMFAIPFGVAIALLPRDVTVVATFFRSINIVFMTMIMWVIASTPIALISLLGASIAKQSDLKLLVSDVGLYVLCALLSLFVHTYVFYPLFLRAFVKGNPYSWINKMARAQTFAFASSSSMATLPVVMECIDATREVTQTLSRFVLSLGATIGMDGASLVYPIAIVFMAEAEGIGHIVGAAEYFLIILVSTIGAVGAGPVPSAGAVMIITIWSSVFPSVPLPSTFAFVVATDWFIDRFQTSVNVTCDTIVCRILAEQLGETIKEEDRASLVSAVDDLTTHKPELRKAIDSSTARE
ncbi:hypothetical protein H257_04167 [Aphanomyces astaci]|uniref:Amino acid transporter n=1 Tax=Aphanomyces astaci TaxID=112090 RepID=W4GUM8_APHAT|nr:hypothetical protein H257_04167 [Aphanomyces astaci]ETV83440.1 hypothetical protein H257_04167 [Aphanomyces astaci]RQM20840.1 hypothetical protein B5M09_011512 [Aphanomyces astaci]|eukprot:XP_009826870.1 hypothetical protein H257_04167 [Aphanomyces astaci]